MELSGSSSAVIHSRKARAMNSGPLWTEHLPAPRVGSSHRPGFPPVGGVEPSLDPDGKGLVDELVDQAHHPEFPSVMGPVLDEVIGPDVIGHRPYSAPSTVSSA